MHIPYIILISLIIFHIIIILLIFSNGDLFFIYSVCLQCRLFYFNIELFVHSVKLIIYVLYTDHLIVVLNFYYLFFIIKCSWFLIFLFAVYYYLFREANSFVRDIHFYYLYYTIKCSRRLIFCSENIILCSSCLIFCS